MIAPQDVFDFWFVDLNEAGLCPPEQRPRWFKSDPEFDAEVCAKFEEALVEAQKGGLKDWESSPKGCAALIILLDQFSRNIFRDQAQMYAGAARALQLSLQMAGEHAEDASNLAPYAIMHRDVVKQFGRFPHRNEILGRETTDAEREFLKTGRGF